MLLSEVALGKMAEMTAVDTTLTSLALLQWMGIWDDTGQNHFNWRRANGKWVHLGWDYDQVMASTRATQSIYVSESGFVVFSTGANWWRVRVSERAPR